MLRRLLANAVLALLALSLVPGYARALVLGSVVNVQAWVNVLLLAILSGWFLVRFEKSVHVLYLAALLLGACALGYVVGGDSEAVALHAFSFAPLAIAFLLLELDVGVSFDRALVVLTTSAAVGAVAANVIHWFRPEMLGLLLKEEDDISGVISLGRVGWAGYVAALPLVAQLGFLDLLGPRQRLLVLAATPLVLVGALLTFNRTLLVTLVVLLGYLLVLRRRALGLKAWTLIALGVGAAFEFGRRWAEVNPQLVHLATYRILLFFSGDSNIGGDVSTRQVLYGEYAERLAHSFFLGQGLGVPVSTYLGNALWADVSLVSVAVPFGVCGVLLFLAFVLRLRRRIVRRIDDPRVRRLFALVLLLALAISLNDDIWTHKNFVVYFVFLVNSYGRGVPRRRVGAVRAPAAARALPA